MVLFVAFSNNSFKISLSAQVCPKPVFCPKANCVVIENLKISGRCINYFQVLVSDKHGISFSPSVKPLHLFNHPKTPKQVVFEAFIMVCV